MPYPCANSTLRKAAQHCKWERRAAHTVRIGTLCAIIVILASILCDPYVESGLLMEILDVGLEVVRGGVVPMKRDKTAYHQSMMQTRKRSHSRHGAIRCRITVVCAGILEIENPLKPAGSRRGSRTTEGDAFGLERNHVVHPERHRVGRGHIALRLLVRLLSGR